MVKRLWILLVLLTVIGFAGTANATLTTIGTATYGGQNYNLIYEGQLGGSGLVWLDYSNPLNTWSNQVSWASGLGGSLAVALDPLYTTTINWSTGWRLPSAGASPTPGYNQTTSEMGHLYYISWGNTVSSGLQNTDPFTQLQTAPNDGYWTGTFYSPSSTAFGFQFAFGYQFLVGPEESYYALAVRPGEVSAVPEPATVLLLGTGLVGLVGLRRRLRK